jgi:signal transduction histidine kinase
MGRLYRRFIEPRQRDEDVRNRERVLNVLTTGTIMAFGIGFSLMLVSLAIGNDVLPRTFLMGGAFGVTLAIYQLSRSGKYTAAAYSLLALYTTVATAVIYRWSASVPPGILLFGLVVVLSGILLGARFILWAMAAVLFIIAVVRQLQVNNIVQPDWDGWVNAPQGLSIMVGCFVLFAVLGMVSWLYTSQMERSLRRARRAEKALRRQKELLEVTVERRTRQLQDAQLERVQQMYRFAELGQLSTALLHDLANHLTTLSLDIEGLEDQKRSGMLQRAKRSIRYIDDMVARVRDQLHGRAQVRPFTIAGEVEEIVSIMTHRAVDAGVRLVWKAPSDKRTLRVKGEPIRFRQLMANLVANAIDAYPPKTEDDGSREVLITAETTATHVVLTINDWGRGIAEADRAKLFEPFFSTKKTGMGMGLFIAKQIAEEHFGGSLSLDSKKKHTSFIVTLSRD